MASNEDFFLQGQLVGVYAVLNVILKRLIETDQIAAMQLEPVLEDVKAYRATRDPSDRDPSDMELEAMKGFDQSVDFITKGLRP